MARVGTIPVKKTFANAVQMPAQRGQVFAAIYQVSPTGSGSNRLVARYGDT